MAYPKLKKSARDYEDWLRRRLDGTIVEDDLVEKHEKMASNPFVFLRGTYWRWAETILDICPELAKAPRVLGVGDIHLENFGTWRDADGRLVWGANDFDEAAEMPYALDIVRLATSAILAYEQRKAPAQQICDAIMKGYMNSLKEPRAIVLDQAHPWLRGAVEVRASARKEFWEKMPPKKFKKKPLPRGFSRVLQDAMPRTAEITKRWPRSAGTGSLGRPRWVACAMWRGAPVLREAKAVVMSAWIRTHGPRSAPLRCEVIARGRFRAPDPWYRQTRGLVVRRLSANNRKIELKEEPDLLLDLRLLEYMGNEIANIHRGTRRVRATIEKDLKRRPKNWLRAAVMKAAAFVRHEHAEWVDIWSSMPKAKKEAPSAP